MKILCLCDSPTIVSGFSRVVQNLFKCWSGQGAVIHCWGIAFTGWGYKKHPYVEVFFPGGAGVAQDHWASAGRLDLFLKQLDIGGYTHVWILQDTFQLIHFDFPKRLRQLCDEKKIKSMLYFPVDAPLDPEWTDILAAVDFPVAFTEFGRREALLKLEERRKDIEKWNQTKPEAEHYDVSSLNFQPDIKVIPHGSDLETYHPLADRAEIRRTFWREPFAGPDDFLMVNVNVNQRRKDVARSLQVLKTVREMGVPAKLIMHMACCSDDNLDLELVGRQLGLQQGVEWAHHGHLFVRGQSRWPENNLVKLYNIADLYLTTTLGEGWGLGITEALSCGTPVALPEHTSCYEIFCQLRQFGMGNQLVLMPVEPFGLFQGLDHSRYRNRVDITYAATRIKDYYDSGTWRHRPGLNEGARQWLSWSRIAREMRDVMLSSTPQKSPGEVVSTPEEPLSPVEL